MAARSWREVRAEALATGKLDKKRLAEGTDRLLNEVIAHRLVEMREETGLSQRAVAKCMGVSQARVSKIERGEIDKTEVATIRSYVAAIGGEVEIVAKFGPEHIVVSA